MPLRILHVFRAPVGGLFRHVLDLAGAQAERGHAVGLVCDSTTGGERAEAQLAALRPVLALGVTRLPMRRNPHWSDLTAQRAIDGLARRRAVDVVHGHGSKGGLYARLPGVFRRHGPVRAYTPHGGSLNYNPGSALHRIYMGVERVLERGTSLFLFESQFVADRFRRFVGPTDAVARVVLNGLHAREFEPVRRRPDAADFLYIGEFRFAKGLDVLLRAAALLRDRMGRAPTLHLVGAGPDETQLRSSVETLDLTGNVGFSQPMAAREAFARGRVMVLPSRFESMPYVVLEAAACAMPLISTDVGGIPEIFGEDADRLVPSDDVEALAAAMHAAIMTPEDALLRSANALRESVRARFSVETMATAVLEAYRFAGAGRHVSPVA